MIYRLQTLTALLLYIPLYSLAEDILPLMDNVSSVSTSLGIDSDKNLNRQLQINIELPRYQQISAGYGNSVSSSSLLNTSQFFIGAATNPYEPFSLGAEYSKWGKDKGLEIRNLQTDLFINFEQWSLSLSPQISIVTFYGNGAEVIDSGKYDLYSQGVSISSTFYGFEDYFIGFNYFRNQFADDPFFFKTDTLKELALDQISESAQLLMTGLEKHHEGMSIGRFFSWGSVEIDFSHSKAALVDAQSNTFTFIIDYELTKQFSLNLITSRQTATSNALPDNSVFYAADFGFSMNW